MKNNQIAERAKNHKLPYGLNYCEMSTDTNVTSVEPSTNKGRTGYTEVAEKYLDIFKGKGGDSHQAFSDLIFKGQFSSIKKKEQETARSI